MLCGRFGVERSRPLSSAANQSRFTRRQIARRRDLVIAQAERGYATVFDEHLFANGHAQTLQHAAFDLSLMGQRINHYGDIMEAAQSPDLNLTALLIDLNVGDHGLKDMLARPDPSVVISKAPPGLARGQGGELLQVQAFFPDPQPNSSVAPLDSS